MTARAAGATSTRAVFFDWYGTLVPLGPLDAACEALAPGRGADVAARWRSRQLEASWLRTIMGRWAEFDTITAEALEVTLAEADVEVSAVRIADLVRTFLELPVRDDSVATVNELRGHGLAVGVLSNGSHVTLTRGVRAGRLTVDYVLSADDAHVFKPHPALYQLAVDRTALEPTEIGFVTANGWDAAGATAFGFNVLWLRSDGSTQLPAVGSPPPTPGSWADVPRFVLSEDIVAAR